MGNPSSVGRRRTNRAWGLFPALLFAGQFAFACSEPAKSTAALFAFEGVGTEEGFYDAPYPNDLRLTPQGTPDVAKLPYFKSGERIARGLLTTAGQRKGFPTNGSAYFRFDGPVAKASSADVIPAGFTSPIFLVNVDSKSTDYGKTYPVVAQTLVHDLGEDSIDPWVPTNVLAVAPRPGVVLAPQTKYAFVVKRSFGSEDHSALSSSSAFAEILRGTPQGARGADLVALYAPLATLLKEKGVPGDDLAVATVFTTGDVVQDTFALSEQVKGAYSVEPRDLHTDPDDGNHPGYCEVLGTLTYPQFQAGTPPFNTEGLFDLDSSGMPKKQRDEVSTMVITIPKNTPMPPAGFPLTFYFHGSGSAVDDIVNASKKATPEDDGPKGEGPAMILASKGFASAASALPFSVDRYPGATEQQYLNLANLAAFRDTFRQGIVEQRLFIEAVKKLKITRAMTAGCTGIEFPAGKDEVIFDPQGVYAMGQSMGGAYTNYLSATEPSIRAAVPTGAGGFWGYFILETKLIPNAKSLVSLALLGTGADLTFMHPALNLLATAWEPVDPLVYANRVGMRPLPGHPARPIYAPVGRGDRYFPTPVFDAMALSYGGHQAGAEAWPAMQQALTLTGHEGIRPYPLSNNAQSADGRPFTGAVVQYEGDGIGDPHAIYRQLDAVKYQYGCFLSSMQNTGIAKVVAPAPLGTPCP